MKDLDLQPLVEAAVIIDQEEGEIRRCEVTLSAAEDQASVATPALLERLLRDIGTLSHRTAESRWTTPVLWDRLRTRIERNEDHPEVMALMGRLLTQAHVLRSSLLRLRRRIRDLELVLVGAVRDLGDQSVDSRFLRLVAGEYGSMTATEMHEAVEKDHAAIADAMATWRLSNGDPAVLHVLDRIAPGRAAGPAATGGHGTCATRRKSVRVDTVDADGGAGREPEAGIGSRIRTRKTRTGRLPRTEDGDGD